MKGTEAQRVRHRKEGPEMLVKLYALPSTEGLVQKSANKGGIVGEPFCQTDTPW